MSVDAVMNDPRRSAEPVRWKRKTSGISPAQGITFVALCCILSIYFFSVGNTAQALLFCLGNGLSASALVHGINSSFRRGSLLEPMPLFLVGQYIYYGPGNWAAVTEMELYRSNPGSLDFYPISSVLAGIGLLAYVIIYNQCRIRFDPASMAARTDTSFVRVSVISILGPLIYLVIRQFVGHWSIEQMRTEGFGHGAGQGTTGILNWLGLTAPYFLFLSIFYGAWNLREQRSRSRKLFIVSSILVAMAAVLMFGSRTGLIDSISLLILMALEKNRTTMHDSACGKANGGLAKTLVIGIAGCVAAYAAGSIVKMTSREGINFYAPSVFLERIREGALQDFDVQLGEMSSRDIGYRMTGLEFTSAILRAQTLGKEDCMYGRVFAQDAINAFPTSVLRIDFLDQARYPSELLIDEQYGLENLDQGSTALSSAVADFGVLGVLVYFPLLGIFHARVWLRLYLAPKTFPAYLGLMIVFLLPDQSIGATFFEWFKQFGFLWLVVSIILLILNRWGKTKSVFS